MKRLQLIEIHDQEWCPRAIRDAVTDYLQFVIAKMKGYAPVVPVLAAALQRTATRQVLDLCSGAGGPWFWLQPVLAKRGLDVSVCLTDKYPNPDALGAPSDLNLGHQVIRYLPEPVDVTGVPDELAGFRTLFSAFHHFRPEQARAILSDAMRKHQGIAVFEGTYHSAPAMFLMLLVPLMVLLVTPFIRPFRWSRLLWTYLVPVVPLVSLFDGLVSCLRTYSVPELRALTEGLDTRTYQWEIGEVRSMAGPIPITYLIGVPVDLGTRDVPSLGPSPAD
jgi:hypothetical protein